MKAEVDKLEINKLVNVPTKDDLDADKMKTVPVNFTKK